VLRENPELDTSAITASLATHYGLRVASITYLPIGFDLRAAVYRAVAADGAEYFLKVRLGPVFEPGLRVPRAITDLGIPNVLAPLAARSGSLWAPVDVGENGTLVVYPFVHGESAGVAGLTPGQFRVFGETMQAVHSSGLEAQFREALRVEDFTLPSAALVRRLLALIDSGAAFASPAATRLAGILREHAGRIRATLERAEELGRLLQSKSFELVLCHGDIHLTNIIVADDGRIWLVDWDGPLIAPRERDLLFVVGSRIGRRVLPEDEDCFFAGYGPTVIDSTALAYYRYERLIEDLGEDGRSVLIDPNVSEAMRAAETDLVHEFVRPGGDIDCAEQIHRTRWPGP
jgi:spectinomycin phosphotransferase